MLLAAQPSLPLSKSNPRGQHYRDPHLTKERKYHCPVFNGTAVFVYLLDSISAKRSLVQQLQNRGCIPLFNQENNTPSPFLPSRYIYSLYPFLPLV